MPSTHDIDTPLLLRLYGIGTTIRFADEQVQGAIEAGQFDSPLHYSVLGQELISASLANALGSQDHLVSTYRNLGDAVARGAPLVEVFGELMGRSVGASKGKGGPMHMCFPAQGLTATTGIVGAGVPIAVGLGLSNAMRGGKHVSVVTFGDGATSTGAFHEGANLAAAWGLPVLFVCINNGYAMHTRVSEYTCVPTLAAKATAYGIGSRTVDGYDVAKVHGAIRDAVATVRATSRPSFLEVVVVRRTPHGVGSDGSYMDPSVIAQAQRRDPLRYVRNELIDSRGVSRIALDDTESRIRETVRSAFEAARESPPPPPEELHRDVFAEGV